MGKWRPPGEAFEGRAIEPGTVIQPVYRPGQYADLRDRLVRALGQPTQAAAGSARLLGRHPSATRSAPPPQRGSD